MDKLVKWLENLLRAQKKSRAWRTFVSCLAAIVVFTTTYSLILPAITVESSATDSVGGLVVQEADPGSTGTGAEASADVVTVEAENETPEDAAAEEAPAAYEESAPAEDSYSAADTSSASETAKPAESTPAVVPEVKVPANGEVQTIGDKRVMILTGEDFDLVVSGDLSVGVVDGTVLSVRGIADEEVAKSYSDRIAEELLKIFVDKKTTEVLYQLVFTDENSFEYAPTGYFDVQFIFHRNTVSHTGEKIYAAIYDYLTDEMILAEKNGDEYETPVISLDEYGIIEGITLKGMHFDEFTDVITLVAGPVNEELKLAAEKAAEAAATESKAENAESADSKAEKTESTDSAEKTEGTGKTDSTAKTESTDAKTDSSESKAEGPTAKAETSKGSETAESGALTARGTDYTVTLTYGADAKIPAGASLEVSEIENGTKEYEKYLAQAKAAMGLDKDQELPKEQARFFDIRIMVDGKEVQPSANVSVNITYDQPVVEAVPNAEAQVDASAVHFGKKGAEVVTVNDVDASRVEFEAESFSVYGVIYTVDFEYTDPTTGGTYYYSLNGGESINLTELLVLLGIKSEDEVEKFVAEEVENVEFSDPELVRVTHNGKVLGLFGSEDWLLESLQAFNTEETLTISLKNGEKIEVKVTDAPADFSPSTYTNIESDGHLEADLKEGTTVNYDAGSQEYKASVDSHFNIPTNIVKQKKNFYVKLGPNIHIPDNQLGVVKRADDHQAKMHAFNYYFAKDGDDYYMVVEYQDKYLNDVAIVRQGNVSMDLLVGSLDRQDDENSKFNFTDNIPITVPNNKIEYPENENENSDITVDKSYGGMGTTTQGEKTVTYLDYTVTVSSKKGTSENITLQDTLKNLTLQLNPGGDKTVNVSDVSIVAVNTTGNASGQGTLVKDVDNKSFTLTLNKINGGAGTYTVTYRYILDQEIPQELEEGQRRIYATGTNTIKAESGPIKHSDEDSFKIEKENKPVTIEKNGSYDADTNRITWTITLTLKNGNHDLTDEMFADTNDLTVVKEGGASPNYTQSADKKTLHFNDPGTYTITYTTEAKPDAYSKYEVKNTATAEDGTKGESNPVEVPRTDEGYVDKQFSMSEQKSASDGIEVYDLHWNVTFAVPETMRKGTVITDKVVLNQNYNDKLGYHEFTAEQQAEFLRLINEAFGGTDLFTMQVNKQGSSVYEIVLTLKDDYTRPANVASMKSISYTTTARIDLATANPGLVSGGATDSYRNTFKIGDLGITAEFNYKKEVNKIDFNNGKNGEKETNVTVSRSGDRTLVWAIVLNLQGDYSTMTVTDTLPAGLTVTKIMAGDQNNATEFAAPDFTKTYSYQNDNSVRSISVNKTDSGTDLVIQLAEGEDRSNTFFKDGQRYYIYVYATVDDDQFDSLVNNVIEYTNNVSVTADGTNLGDDHQTQRTTLDSEAIGKDTVKSAVSDEVSKEDDWKKWHWLSYAVSINADGHEMNGGQPFAMEDVLSFNKYSPDGVEVSFSLVPNSVRLQVKNGQGEWVDKASDTWTYQFKETKDGDLRIKTISLANLPDNTPMRLLYTYEVALDGNEPGKSYNIGDVKNTATIHGERDFTIEHHEQKNWEEFQSEASQTSSNTLTLSKVDLEDYNKLLPGTKFVLEKWDGSQWVVTDAVTQEPTFYRAIEDDPSKFDGTGATQPISHENRSYYIYQTVNNPNNRRHGTLQLYMPVPDIDGYDGPYFEAGVCYRAREYEAPSENGYIVDGNPDNQPAAYFYFSRDENDYEVGAPTQWPSDKIRNLADDISKESDAFYVTNAKEPSIKITKKFIGDAEITDAQKKAMSFDVYYAGEDGTIGGSDDVKLKTLTYADILSNKNILKASDEGYGQHIKNKGVYYAVEHGIDLLGVNWTVTYIINNGVEESTDITDSTTFDSRTTVTTGSMTIDNNVGTIDFINKYDIPKTSIKVTKEWLNPDGTTNTNPDKTTIKFQVYQMEEGATKGHPYVPEGADSPKTYEIKYEGGSWSEVEVKDLPKYADSVNRTGPYSYYVVETDPASAIQTTYKIGVAGTEGDAASAASTDTTSPIVIVNKDTSVTVTKKFVDKLGNEKTPSDGATIKFKILGQAKQNWSETIEEYDAIGETILQYNAADQQWYKQGTREVFNAKLPVERDNRTFINYYIKELEPTNYSVTYLINGLPQSDSNQLRNDETQTVTIVNAEKVPDGEIIVKKVWQNDEGETIPAPSDINDITVKVRQVPISIAGKGDAADVRVQGIWDSSVTPLSGFAVGDIIDVSFGPDYAQQFEYEGCRKLAGADYGNNLTQTILITEANAVIKCGGASNITAQLSSMVLPDSEGVTKELTLSKPNWVSGEVNLQQLFGEDFNLYGYQIEESSVPPGFTVAYMYDGTYEDGEMTGSVSGGLLTVYNTKSNGSLKLKKNVTVNEFANGSSTLTNGTYTFNIVKSDNSAVTHEVKLTFAAGEITEATIDGVDAEADENGFYEVTNLDPGDYVITEAPVENGTKLTDVSGGKDDGSTETRNITVTVEAGKKGTEVPPAATAEFTNNINTGSITVTKSVEKPADLTLTKKFKIALKDSDDNYYKQDGTIATDETDKWIEFSTSGEAKTWSHLPVGKTYTVEEDTVTAPTGYICITEVSDEIEIEDVPFASGTATVKNKYQQTETEYSFKKIWLDSNGANANKQEWPNGKNLGITLYRNASYKKTDNTDAVVPEESVGTYAIPVGGLEPDNITVTKDETNTWYVVKFAKLEKYVPAEKLTDAQGDVKWTYYVKETTVPDGFSLQYGDADGNVSQSNTFAKEGESVINSLIEVTLPSTGGPGTRLYYSLGIAFIAMAGIILFIKRKEMRSLRGEVVIPCDED